MHQVLVPLLQIESDRAKVNIYREREKRAQRHTDRVDTAYTRTKNEKKKQKKQKKEKGKQTICPFYQWFYDTDRQTTQTQHRDKQEARLFFDDSLAFLGVVEKKITKKKNHHSKNLSHSKVGAFLYLSISIYLYLSLYLSAHSSSSII
jgi:hypothetical protein